MPSFTIKKSSDPAVVCSSLSSHPFLADHRGMGSTLSRFWRSSSLPFHRKWILGGGTVNLPYNRLVAISTTSFWHHNSYCRWIECVSIFLVLKNARHGIVLRENGRSMALGEVFHVIQILHLRGKCYDEKVPFSILKTAGNGEYPNDYSMKIHENPESRITMFDA